MDRGTTAAPYTALEPLPLRVHAATEPLVVLILAVAPFALGFADETTALAVSLAAAAIVAVQALTTRWRWAPLRLLPLGVHAMGDTLLGIVLLAAPFLLEYHDDTTAGWIVHVAVGLGLLGGVWATSWARTDRPLPPSAAVPARL